MLRSYFCGSSGAGAGAGADAGAGAGAGAGASAAVLPPLRLSYYGRGHYNSIRPAMPGASVPGVLTSAPGVEEAARAATACSNSHRQATRQSRTNIASCGKHSSTNEKLSFALLPPSQERSKLFSEQEDTDSENLDAGEAGEELTSRRLQFLQARLLDEPDAFGAAWFGKCLAQPSSRLCNCFGS